jgi:hypothetical protein
MLNMTKAKRIYNDTKAECKKHIESNGYKNNGFHTLITQEAVSTRTINDIRKLLRKEMEFLLMDKRLNVVDDDYFESELNILKMINKTLKNAKTII